MCHEVRLLTMDEVKSRVRLGKTTIYRLMDAGEFPKQIPIGKHHVAWLESEVNAWIEQRIKMRDEEVGAGERHKRAVHAVAASRKHDKGKPSDTRMSASPRASVPSQQVEEA